MDMSDDDRPIGADKKESRRPLSTVQDAPVDVPVDLTKSDSSRTNALKAKQLAALKAKRHALKKQIEAASADIVAGKITVHDYRSDSSCPM